MKKVQRIALEHTDAGVEDFVAHIDALPKKILLLERADYVTYISHWVCGKIGGL